MTPICKVLTVDDDARNLRILDEILCDEFQVEHALNGEEALTKTLTFKPDIVLLDIMMPGIDGLEVCRRLRADARQRLVKIILVSGKARLEERLQGYQAGADDYVTKPFDDEELRAKVKVFARLKTAEEINRIKTDFLKLITHETNTPLHGILNLAELILADSALPPASKPLTEHLLRCAHDLQKKIDRILLLSQLRMQRSAEAVVPVALRDWVHVAWERVQNDATEKGVRIEIDGEVEGSVAGRYELLTTALHVILENAVKHSPRGGTVTVRFARAAAPALLHIDVADQGPGLAPDALRDVFEEFYCADIGHHGGGMGISLALCRCILALHGGGVEARNGAAGGAVFTLSLPLTP
jgi:signal transduction histidine kinase